MLYRVSFVCVQLAIWCLAGSMPALAQLEGDPELFVRVADAWRSNFESIETWQGEVSVEVHFLSPEAVSRFGEYGRFSARFWYSKGEGALKRIVDTHLGTLPDGREDVRR
ncbi:MAG: hypothetical protein KDA96_26515, partial [Planctomycetaceae bacterium]|nr:hypothetical protein [Planctomycetaceae bacterium]